MRLADFFAGEEGYEPTGERSNPPFQTSVALSHSGTGVEGVAVGHIGDFRAEFQIDTALSHRLPAGPSLYAITITASSPVASRTSS